MAATATKSNARFSLNTLPHSRCKWKGSGLTRSRYRLSWIYSKTICFCEKVAIFFVARKLTCFLHRSILGFLVELFEDLLAAGELFHELLKENRVLHSHL